MASKRIINYLNEKFEGATLFVHDPVKVNYHKTINGEKELEIILKIVEEINKIEYNENKHPFMGTQIKEINKISNMDRPDLKTGWIITKIIQLYEYMGRQNILID